MNVFPQTNAQEQGSAWSASWLVPAAISFLALVCELVFEPLAPLVVPQMCAAALGLKLSSRSFLVLCAVITFGICLPMFFAPDSLFLGQRLGALIGVLVIASIRLPFSPEIFEHPKSTGEIESLREPNDESSPITSMATDLYETDQLATDAADADYAFDLGLANDFVPPALERLKSSGMFDQKQMRMVETEMRLLEGHSIAINYASLLQKGDQVGRFVIDEPLGRGGEGNVFRGYDEHGNSAAIKILHNMRVSDRFRREMQLARHLAHPNIVTAYEVGEFRGLPFITMELLKGPDLHVMVRDSGPLDWMVSAQYVLQTARALAHAHRRGLIHRDVKPGNIIMNGEGVVKLVDLGLAALCATDTMDSVFQFETHKGHLAGTLPFIAPEQARSLANANAQSDIYGLGATWFFLLTGKTRLEGNTFAEHFENLLVRRRFHSLSRECMPRPLRKIYKRMVAYDANDRYASCEELAEQLESALETVGESVSAEDIDVLIVEDSQTDMLFTIEMLRKSNASLRIHAAKSLAEGLEMYHVLSIDVVLLDLSLADSCGIDTITRFRAVAKHVPLVVLTGSSEGGIGAQSIEAGADTFVPKSGLTTYRIERSIFVTLSQRGRTQKS